MSINPTETSRSIGSVTREVGRVEREINSVTDTFRRGNIAVSGAEHQYLYTYSDAAFVAGLVAKLVEILPTYRSSTAPFSEADGQVYQILHLNNRINAALRRFTNVFLTHFPTAQTNYSQTINYGPPLIGPIIECRPNNPPGFHFRQIRDDGNAFLSAVATRFLEELVQQQVVESFIGFVADTNCDANLKQNITTMLRSIQTNPSQLEAILQNNDAMLPFINFLRRVAAQEMLADKPLYESRLRSDMQWIPFANEEQSYEELVAQYVVQMGTKCVPSMMAAVCKMLAFQANINDPGCGVCSGTNILAEGGAPKVFFFKAYDGNYVVRYPEQRTTTTTAPTRQPVAIQQMPTPPIATVEVAVKFNAGYGNSLFVRGNVPGMSWERGIVLRNTGADSWVFAIPSNARNCEFKLVLNDTKFENGLNRKVNNEGQIVNERGQVESPIIPRFSR